MNVEISWGHFLEQYIYRFNQVYEGTDKKLHLSDGTIIEGPGEGWVVISILDAMCAILHPNILVREPSHRRHFVQTLVLPQIISTLATEARDKSSADGPTAEHYVISNPYPHWSDLDALRAFLLAAKISHKPVVIEKFNQQIERLFEIIAQQHGSLANGIGELILKVLSDS
jgi:hypothetical protein